ncbi:MAG: efflux RND transporter periplasmic adaptor subunit [Acidobacteria bacterium]|nr:efflux RND transporter periplasmic adaptor subunit [Acidobacteriota bacterium]
MVTARAELKAVPVTVPAVGTVEAISSVQLRSQITGQLTAIHFTEGRDVRQGDPLFSLDPRPFQAALQQAQAVLARDTATLQNAQAQQTRADALFQRGLLARDQYESQRAGAAALAATVEADKAAVETASLNLKYTEIAAPISGRTGALGVHAGDLIRANDANPLVVINQLSPIYVTFSVPGRFLGDIRRYQAQKPLAVSAVSSRTSRADMAPAAGAAEAASVGGTGGRADSASATQAVGVRGALTFIDNAVDTTTGTIRLKATFTNGDGQLWPGAFVQVTVNLTTQADAVVVPTTAVQESQDGQFVYVVKSDRTVDMRKVRVERQQGDDVVIAQGISAGDVVVTDGQLRLTPGARVSEPAQSGGQRGPAAPAGRGK